MNIIETAHTFSAINRVKKDITELLSVIGIISFICFLTYYGILIVNNFKNLLYLIVYIVLFLTVVISFTTERILKSKLSENRKKQRIKYEQKLVIKRITKIFKYIAKTITIVIAVISLLQQEYLTIMSFFTIVSAAMLIIQLLLEVVTYYVCKYFDYFRLALELDKDNGIITKAIFHKEIKATKLEKQMLIANGVSYYTKQEEKIINELIEEAKLYKEEKKQKIKDKINTCKKSIAEKNKKEYLEKRKPKIDDKYGIMLNKAKEILLDSNEIDNLLRKAEKLLEKLPVVFEPLKYIPIFLSLINNYISKKYTDISIDFIVSVIAIILYLVSPIDIIPDFIKGMGYIDDGYLIIKCLEKFEDELTNFLLWRDS